MSVPHKGCIALKGRPLGRLGHAKTSCTLQYSSSALLSLAMFWLLSLINKPDKEEEYEIPRGTTVSEGGLGGANERNSTHGNPISTVRP